MDPIFLDKLADTTSSSDAQLGLEQFHKQRRLRKLSEQPLVETREELSRLTSLSRSNVQQKLHEKRQAELSLNFESEFTLLNDGNSFYRLVAIEHLRHVLRRPEALNELCGVISRAEFNLQCLLDIPEDIKHLLRKQELPGLFRSIVEDLSHLSNSLFAESLINLMEQNKKVDYAVVATYRLYTYIIGYQTIQGDPMSILLKGDEKQAILTYGCEVTRMVIKLIAESMCASINLYILLEENMENIRVGLDFSDYHNFELSVKLVESHYSLLVPKEHSLARPLYAKKPPKPTISKSKAVSIGKILQNMAVDESALDAAGFTGDFFQQIYERMTETERQAIVMECLRQNFSFIQH